MAIINNTLFVGKVLLHFPSLGSTNDYAINLVSKSNPSEGTVISASAQPHGKGQFGSTWESAAGKNITLSLILYPHFLLPTQQFHLSQAVALALLDFVASFIPHDIKIKWPNDIYVNNKKTAGILIQNSLMGRRFQSSVIGLGINVNQSVFSPALPNPTSFFLQTKQKYALEDLRQHLFVHLEKRYLQLKAGATNTIHQDYLKHLYRLGVKSTFQRTDGSLFDGTICGISPTGKLLVHHHGKQEAFEIKSIKFL